MGEVRHIFTVFMEHPSNYLFSINTISSSDSFKAGKINDEISYRDISFRDKRLKGKLCNDSAEPHSEVFIRFFAMSRKNGIFWDEVVTVDHIEPGQCKPFIEFTFLDRKPVKWKFSVTGC